MKLFKSAILLSIIMLVSGCNSLRKSSSRVDYTDIEGIADSTALSDKDLKEIVIVDSAAQLSGEWTMLMANDKKIKTLHRPFINFDFKENRFYGNNGCNVINGSFSCENSGMKFSNVISTMMACEENETSEKTIMKLLNNTTSIKLYEKNNVIFMHLLNKHGHTIATLKQQNLDFMNGAWTVKELNGKEVSDPNVKLVIDIDQLKIHGNSGCNIINGSLYIDYYKNWAIQFQQLISTMKMCENMKLETTLLVALEVTETCKKINDNEVMLIDKNGKNVAVLKKLDLARK